MILLHFVARSALIFIRATLCLLMLCLMYGAFAMHLPAIPMGVIEIVCGSIFLSLLSGHQ